MVSVNTPDTALFVVVFVAGRRVNISVDKSPRFDCRHLRCELVPNYASDGLAIE